VLPHAAGKKGPALRFVPSSSICKKTTRFIKRCPHRQLRSSKRILVEIKVFVGWALGTLHKVHYHSHLQCCVYQRLEGSQPLNAKRSGNSAHPSQDVAAFVH
jgi:hypothetical protein